MIPGAATDYFACGREAGIYYFGEKRWNESGVLIHNAIDLERFGYRSEVRTRLRREYQLEDKLVVGSVARFMVQKNHTRMLEQFACLKKIYHTTWEIVNTAEMQNFTSAVDILRNIFVKFDNNFT